MRSSSVRLALLDDEGVDSLGFVYSGLGSAEREGVEPEGGDGSVHAGAEVSVGRRRVDGAPGQYGCRRLVGGRGP